MISISWIYEPETFVVSEDLTYTPDFYLPEYRFYIEVKGYFRNERALEKFNLFSAEHKIMLIRRKEIKDLGSILRYIDENKICKECG